MINWTKYDWVLSLAILISSGFDLTYLYNVVFNTKLADITIWVSLLTGGTLRVSYVLLRQLFHVMAYSEWFSLEFRRVFDSLGYEKFSIFKEDGELRPDMEKEISDAELQSILDKAAGVGEYSKTQPSTFETYQSDHRSIESNVDFMVSAEQLYDDHKNMFSEGEIIKFMKKNLMISGTAFTLLKRNNLHNALKYVDYDLLTRGDYHFLIDYNLEVSKEYLTMVVSGSEQSISEEVSILRGDPKYIITVEELLLGLPNSQGILGVERLDNGTVIAAVGKMSFDIHGGSVGSSYMTPEHMIQTRKESK